MLCLSEGVLGAMVSSPFKSAGYGSRVPEFKLQLPQLLAWASIFPDQCPHFLSRKMGINMDSYLLELSKGLNKPLPVKLLKVVPGS